MQELKRLLTLSLTVVILFVVSCQKTDTLTTPQLTDNALVQRFLSLPTTVQPHILRIAGAMQQADSRNHFIASLTRQHGFAQWVKALTTNMPNNRSGRNTTTPNGDTIVYIPLVIENAQHVNAFICARLNGSISMQLHRETDFSSYGFGALQDTVPNADKLAVQFMVLDFEVFGHERFKLLHDSLMHGPALPSSAIVGGKIVNISKAPVAARSAQTLEYDICTDTRYLDCTSNHTCCPDGSCSGCQEHCWKTNTVCQKVSVLVFVDNGNWGNGDLGTGGGGSGGGIIQPNGMVPCNPTPLLDNGLIPCPVGNTTGWMPYLPAEVIGINDLQVTDPCLKAIIDYIGQPGHNSLLLQSYDHANYTPSTTHRYKVNYLLDTSLVGQNGQPVPGHTDVVTAADGTHMVTISLNNKLFQNASKEWVTGLVLHELQHGIYKVTKPFDSTNELSHKAMFLNKVPLTIKYSLMQLFPSMDENDAFAIGMDGLGLPGIFLIPDPNNPGMEIIDPAVNQFSIQHYFQSIAQAIDAVIPYRTGTLGTPYC